MSYATNDNNNNNNNNQMINSLIQTIGTNIQKISQNVIQMTGLVDQIGEDNDTDQLRERLLQLENYTNQVAKDASKQLKDLNNYLKSSNDRTLRLQKERLTNELMKVLNRFQDLQKLSMQKQRDTNEAAKRNLGYDDNETFRPNNDSVINTISFGNEQLQATGLSAAQIAERENALRKLEHDISDVNTIFKDLALMVHDQGETVNSIELNITQTQSRVQTANEDLRRAVGHQQKARQKKVIFFSIMALIMAVIILVIILSLRPWNKS